MEATLTALALAGAPVPLCQMVWPSDVLLAPVPVNVCVTKVEVGAVFRVTSI